MHADESCLGNQTAGPSKGGAASLIETRSRGAVARRDLYIHSNNTTNNRMALSGAIETLRALARKKKRLAICFISDSQYLIKGMTEWIEIWKARGWRRKSGRIENLALWQTLSGLSSPHSISWKWVRGHAGHPKNEYVNDMAIKAATEQTSSDGPVKSKFDAWLAERVAGNETMSYDPDIDFEAYESATTVMPN